MPSIFLCHSAADKAFVRHLANRLRACNVRVWLDEAEMKIGDSLTGKVGKAIREADYVAAILSNQSIHSKWVQRELQIAIEEEFRRENVVVLPILLENVDLPAFLSDKYYADFTLIEEYDLAFSKLLDSLGIIEEKRMPFDYLKAADKTIYYLNGSPVQRLQPFYIYYHMDMDGIGSAVVFALYLKLKYKHRIDKISFVPVDFDIDKKWHRYDVRQPSAILDFLYHPNAIVYFDHHQHPFVTEDFKKHYYLRENEWVKLNCRATSVINVLFKNLPDLSGTASNRLYNRLKTFVKQIDIIDSAQYDGTSSSSMPQTPCDKINLILNGNRNENFCNQLVLDLLSNSPEKLIKDGYKDSFERAHDCQLRERDKIRKVLKIVNGIVFYDTVFPKTIPFFRFIPYEFFPDAYFVVAIYVKDDSYEVSIGKNPFKAPPYKKDIGEICKKFGGGGHEQVGGITVPSYKSAREIAEEVITLLYSDEE